MNEGIHGDAKCTSCGNGMAIENNCMCPTGESANFVLDTITNKFKLDEKGNNNKIICLNNTPDQICNNRGSQIFGQCEFYNNNDDGYWKDSNTCSGNWTGSNCKSCSLVDGIGVDNDKCECINDSTLGFWEKDEDGNCVCQNATIGTYCNICDTRNYNCFLMLLEGHGILFSFHRHFLNNDYLLTLFFVYHLYNFYCLYKLSCQ